MCYERATDTSCVAGNRMILLDRLGETAPICTNLTTTPEFRYRRCRFDCYASSRVIMALPLRFCLVSLSKRDF